MSRSILITSGGILLEAVIEKLLLSNVVTASLSTFLAPIITGLLTGLTIALVTFGLDKIDLFDAKEKSIDQQVSQRIMDELWVVEKEMDGLIIAI